MRIRIIVQSLFLFFIMSLGISSFSSLHSTNRDIEMSLSSEEKYHASSSLFSSPNQLKRTITDTDVKSGENPLSSEHLNKKACLDLKNEEVIKTDVDKSIKSSPFENLPYEILENIWSYNYPTQVQGIFYLGALNRSILYKAMKCLQDRYPSTFFQTWKTWILTKIDNDLSKTKNQAFDRAIHFRNGIGNIALYSFLSILSSSSLENDSLYSQSIKGLLKLIPTSGKRKEEYHYLCHLAYNTPIPKNIKTVTFMEEVRAEGDRLNPNARNLYAVWKGRSCKKVTLSDIKSAIQIINRRGIDGNSIFFYTHGISAISKKLAHDEKSIHLYVPILELTISLGYYGPAYLYFPHQELVKSKVERIAEVASFLTDFPKIITLENTHKVLEKLKAIDVKKYNFVRGFITSHLSKVYTLQANSSNSLEDWQRAVDTQVRFVEELQTTGQDFLTAKIDLAAITGNLVHISISKAIVSQSIDDFRQGIDILERFIKELQFTGQDVSIAKMHLANMLGSLALKLNSKAITSNNLEDWQRAVDIQTRFVEELQTNQDIIEAKKVLSNMIKGLAQASRNELCKDHLD